MPSSFGKDSALGGNRLWGEMCPWDLLKPPRRRATQEAQTQGSPRNGGIPLGWNMDASLGGGVLVSVQLAEKCQWLILKSLHCLPVYFLFREAYFSLLEVVLLNVTFLAL